MKFKRNLLKYVVLSTLFLTPVTNSTIEMASVYAQEARALSVTEYLNQGVEATSGQTITVEGYITGSLKSQKAYENVKTNLALGASQSASAVDTVPIQLPNNALRRQYNIVDHPEFIGKKVRITGKSALYFSRAGIKPITKLEVVDEDAPTPTPVIEQPETTSSETITSETSTSHVSSTTLTPISTLRASEPQRVYTVRGKIISVVNGWGGHGFYIVDESAQGVYVYPRQDLGHHLGEVVQLTGTLSEYKGELQLIDMTNHTKVENVSIETAISTVTIPELHANKQATMIKLENVTVGDIASDTYGTSSFTVTDEQGQQVAVRLDNRTGVTNAQLLSKIDRGDKIHLTGILSTYNGQKQIKPFDLAHFEMVQKADRTTVTDVLKIGDIQGAGHTSPLNQRDVTVSQVVVTAIEDNNRFYVQDITPDDNVKTSDGISVSKNNHRVAVGDVLTIQGRVNEYLGNGYKEKKQTDLTITEIRANRIEKTGVAPVPNPIVLGVDKHIPTDVIDNDGMSSFDPQEDALDFWESIEGMLVAVDDAKILGPMAHKEVFVLPKQATSVLNNVGGVSIALNDFNPERVPLLFKRGAFTVKSGDAFSGRLSGPVSYSFTNYKVLIDDTLIAPTVIEGQTKPEKTTIQTVEDKLTIASYNIENFSANPRTTPQEKVERIARSFVDDLNTPDIITLVEVQDNNGTDNDGTTDASQSAKRLIDAIVAQGGPRYVYVDIAPENNQDGGAPGGNIRTGYLYNPTRVSLSNKPVGQVAAWENGELKYSVARLNPTHPAWRSVRKPLVAEFEFKGEKIAVISTHLNSKRGDNGLFGKVQPIVFKSEVKRHELAEQLKAFAAEGIAKNANVVMLGDFNDFEFTETLHIIERAGMTNLVSHHDERDRFSYFYQGNNQSLDHLLISNNLLNHYVFDMVHVNSPFMTQHGRASDHDPLIVQLSLRKADSNSETESSTTESSNEAVETTTLESSRVETEAPTTESSRVETEVPTTESSRVETDSSTIESSLAETKAPTTESHRVETAVPATKNNHSLETETTKSGQVGGSSLVTNTTGRLQSKQTNQKDKSEISTDKKGNQETLPYTGETSQSVFIGVLCLGLSMVVFGFIMFERREK